MSAGRRSAGGFSSKWMIRPLASIFRMPKLEAWSGETGMTPTVASAPLSRCVRSICR